MQKLPKLVKDRSFDRLACDQPGPSPNLSPRRRLTGPAEPARLRSAKAQAELVSDSLHDRLRDGGRPLGTVIQDSDELL